LKRQPALSPRVKGLKEFLRLIFREAIAIRQQTLNEVIFADEAYAGGIHGVDSLVQGSVLQHQVPLQRHRATVLITTQRFVTRDLHIQRKTAFSKEGFESLLMNCIVRTFLDQRCGAPEGLETIARTQEVISVAVQQLEELHRPRGTFRIHTAEV